MATPDPQMNIERIIDEGELDEKKLVEIRRKDTNRYHVAGERLPKMDPNDPTKASVALSRGALWKPSYWSLRKQKLGLSSDP